MGGSNQKGQKKEQPKKEQPVAQQKNKRQKPPQQDENSWMYDLILQYLASPIWRNPISDFLDENCIIFDDEEENKIVYQDIHKRFKSMIEQMIETLMIDIGVDDEEQLRKVIEMGLRNKKHKKYFEQLLIVDNFLVFKKLMLKRNKELEYEALKELQKQDGGKNPEVEMKLVQAQLDKERMEIEHAVAMSLAVEKEKAKLSFKEDEDLEEAIRQSEILYQQQQSEILRSTLEQSKPPAEIQHSQPPPVQKQEQPEQKAESILMFEDEPIVEPVKKYEQPVPVNQAPPQEKPDVKKREPLPQIIQQKKEVSQMASEREALMEQMKQLKQESKEMDAAYEQNMKNQQAQETLEERKKRLQQQRELIKQKKAQERQKELENYQAVQGTDQEKQQEPQKEKDPLIVDMADFIDEQKKAQKLQEKKEELRKRAELMKKIKQDVQQEGN